MTDPKPGRPALKVFQSLWAMQPHGRDGVKLPLEAACEMVAEAGYDGLAIDLGAADVATAHEVRPHLERLGLTPLIVAFPGTVPALRETIAMAKDFGSPFVDVIGRVFPLSVEGGIPVIRRWIEMGEEAGMPLHFEAHRDCITTDLFYTAQLMDAVPEMRMGADLSHYVVGREMRLPLSPENAELVRRVLARSDSFQGRVASRQQIQLQIGFPQHRKWVELFEGFWRQGFESWAARNQEGAPIFLCELGPPEYAMTDAEGRELSDRWEEGLILRRTAMRLWDEVTGRL